MIMIMSYILNDNDHVLNDNDMSYILTAIK